ncbi:MAG: MarR family winged helix-turn-helix transcriptional regulator [Bacteroidales bacterium]|nr:MarR family winged helix-turn-helix transcriptional regulator [Bacteroidales bacterium]
MRQYRYDTSLGNLAHRISRGLGLRLLKKLQSEAIPVNQEQWCVISMLCFSGSTSQQQIADFLGYDKVKVLRLLLRLEKDKIICRKKDRNDRRINKVELTQKGKVYYDKIKILAEDTLSEAYSGLSSGEEKKLLKNLMKIKDNLEKQGCAKTGPRKYNHQPDHSPELRDEATDLAGLMLMPVIGAVTVM